MRLIRAFILCLIALIGITFAVLNSQSVTVEYYIGSHAIPLSLLLIGTLIIGAFIGYLVSLPSIFRLKLELRKHRHHEGG